MINPCFMAFCCARFCEAKSRSLCQNADEIVFDLHSLIESMELTTHGEEYLLLQVQSADNVRCLGHYPLGNVICILGKSRALFCHPKITKFSLKS